MMSNRDYWQKESARYFLPHYRLAKVANIVNLIASGRHFDLLDVGCGPATLARFIRSNINYFGIDLIIHEPAENLIESDLSKNKIAFGDKKFDLVVAQGFFEYMDGLQRQKLSEISYSLKDDGKFIAAFLNFNHRHFIDNPAYNNKMATREFFADLTTMFHVDRYFPTSYNWHGSEPRRKWLAKLELPLRLNIPFLGRKLGVEYIFVCSKNR